MEASTSNNKSFIQPRSILELLPDLSAILSKDAMETLASTKKAPRTKTVLSGTVEKTKIKPMTLAEMRGDILALKPQSPQQMTSVTSMKRGWNSSVRVEYKKISHTARGQLKNNPVRKVLNFQPPTKPKPAITSRIAIVERFQNAETPKFPKPESRPKKSIHVQPKSLVRISGIGAMPQTPLDAKSSFRKRMDIANKENSSLQANVIKKQAKLLPMPVQERVISPKTDTLMNSSWKSGSDASFLQKEKEINEVEENVLVILEERTLEKIAEISPPISTPFKEYRSVQEFFNNSNSLDNSSLYNDTIRCFERPLVCVDSEKKEESVIMSLCDLFNKATVVTNGEKEYTVLDNLLEVEKQKEQEIKMIECIIQMLTDMNKSDVNSQQKFGQLVEEKKKNSTMNNLLEVEKYTVHERNMLERIIEMLTNMKRSYIESLQNVRQVLEENKNSRKNSDNENNKTLVDCSEIKKTVLMKTPSPDKNPIISRPCSVIRSTRSPTYKIPKKNSCLRKKVISKSMPNVSNIETTPVRDFEGKALNMYMTMKDNMNFLSTPSVNRDVQVPDTPALTSRNLQKQLDKLFGS